MTAGKQFPRQKTLEVRDTCLCLHAQRAARVLARRFDDAFRPLGMTNGQFSLLNALNRAEPATISEVADFLAMDRTTLTALIKPLEARKWIKVTRDGADRRKRRLALTARGHGALLQAYPVWRATHDAIEAHAQSVRSGLMGLVDDLRSR
jgi:DNA-binding MarR family transcriptional regulator